MVMLLIPKPESHAVDRGRVLCPVRRDIDVERCLRLSLGEVSAPYGSRPTRDLRNPRPALLGGRQTGLTLAQLK